MLDSNTGLALQYDGSTLYTFQSTSFDANITSCETGHQHDVKRVRIQFVSFQCAIGYRMSKNPGFMLHQRTGKTSSLLLTTIRKSRPTPNTIRLTSRNIFLPS
ncbi:unnamed protein product [Musa hybrid cultivar]